MTQITAKGFREVDAKLAALGSQRGTRIVRRAILIAADPIVEQAKHNLAGSSHSGALAKSIGRRFVVGTRGATSSFLPALGGRFAAVIAPFKSDRVATALHNLVYGRKRKGIFYGHLIEFGHRVSVAARPFLAPALFARARDAVNIFRAEVKAGIERELKRGR